MLNKNSFIWLQMCQDFGSDDDKKHATNIINDLQENKKILKTLIKVLNF